jgi:hypothetical protein
MYQLFHKYIVVVLFFTGLSVVSAAPGKVFLDKEFSLALGQTATIEGEKLVIKFKAVLEDSRCPVNVVCVWAGNGKVEFETLDIDGQNKTVILNTEEEPRATTLKGHKLTLISLNPPRIDGVSISPGDYSVTLRVDRKPFRHMILDRPEVTLRQCLRPLRNVVALLLDASERMRNVDGQERP